MLGQSACCIGPLPRFAKGTPEEMRDFLLFVHRPAFGGRRRERESLHFRSAMFSQKEGKKSVHCGR